MILIFGGAYQGKTEFAKENFNIQDEACLMDNLHNWIRELVEGGRDTAEAVEALIADIEKQEEELAGREVVVIMNDVSQGIVPMDPVERKFREANGRAMIKLASHAGSVYRVFCGIGTKIK